MNVRARLGNCGGSAALELDQAVILEIAEQVHHLALALPGLDLIFVDQPGAKLVQPPRPLEHPPYRARRAVEAVAGAVVDVQGHDLPVHLGFDESVLPTYDDVLHASSYDHRRLAGFCQPLQLASCSARIDIDPAARQSGSKNLQGALL